MAMHYTRQKVSRLLTLLMLATITEEECWEIFRRSRFGDEAEFACPECKVVDKHGFIKTRRQWTCKNCDYRFSVTSGTAFHHRKLSFKKLLIILLSFINAAQGANANFLPSQLGITYKTGFLNYGKIREVIFETMNHEPLTGIVHTDCLHICGKPRRSNVRKSSDSFVINNKLRARKDGIVPDQKTHPEPWNLEKLKNRRIVLVMSQLALNDDGAYGSNRTITYIIRSEKSQVILPLINKAVSNDAIVMSDFGSAFNMITPALGLTHLRVNHSVQYQDELGVNNNQAESFFSRIRRAEYGTYNGISKNYLAFYAAEFAYRNDSKYEGVNERFDNLLTRILKREPSKAFCGYSQGNRLGFEYCHE